MAAAAPTRRRVAASTSPSTRSAPICGRRGSWLETFTTRGARFYQRAGFTLLAWHEEPTTGRAYAILERRLTPLVRRARP